MGIGKYEMIHGYPNGTTHQIEDLVFSVERRRRRTRGTETSKYPEEEKTTVIFQVVASERERAQTWLVTADWG